MAMDPNVPTADPTPIPNPAQLGAQMSYAAEPSQQFTPLTAIQIGELLGQDSGLAHGEALNHFTQLASAHQLGEDAVRAFGGFEQFYREQLDAQGDAEAEELNQQWLTETERDPVLIGGDGFEANIKAIRNVVTKYGGDPHPETGLNEIQQLMDATGFGNHPVVLKFLLNLSKSMPGEGLPTSGSPSGGEQSLADRFFGGNN